MGGVRQTNVGNNRTADASAVHRMGCQELMKAFGPAPAPAAAPSPRRGARGISTWASLFTATPPRTICLARKRSRIYLQPGSVCACTRVHIPATPGRAPHREQSEHSESLSCEPGERNRSGSGGRLKLTELSTSLTNTPWVCAARVVFLVANASGCSSRSSSDCIRGETK
jgi:hypothetical protein